MQQDLLLKSYNYKLPRKNIAQHPADQRDESRLLVLNRQSGHIEHKRFRNIIELIDPNDLLVVNDTKVFPARLMGKKETGGRVELFLLEFPLTSEQSEHKTKWLTATAPALIKSSKRPRPGTKILLGEAFFCTVVELLDGGKVFVKLHFNPEHDLSELFHKYGQVPLPPYIERDRGTTDKDLERYQTVYANRPGAVAAPTAGLHFTEPLLELLEEKGVRMATITLHVGYGTFAPVRTDNIDNHVIHEEYVHISDKTTTAINTTKKSGGKIWAVGTTTVRALEYAAAGNGELSGMDGWCNLYITPGYHFKIVDKLITNFHLPQSSLLFLVSALCGRERLLACYREAIDKDYRFYSYGDAMAIV